MSIKEYNNCVLAEIERVKGLTYDDDRSNWIDNARDSKAEFWEDDKIYRLPRVGGTKSKTYTRLVEAGIKKVKDLLAIHPDKLPPIRGIKQLQTKAKTAQSGSCPDRQIDHQSTNNPYQSKYGRIGNSKSK